MKIVARALADPGVLDELERRGLTDLVGGRQSEISVESHWPNAGFQQFLEEAAELGELDINPWMDFTRREVERADFLQLGCRKFVQDTTREFERMRSEIDEQPWLGGDPMRRFRLPERIYLSRIKLKPNRLAGIGEWLDEYVLPVQVVRLLEGLHLSGFDTRPIRHVKTAEEHSDYRWLWTDRVLGHRVLDAASPEIRSSHPEERGYDQWGCLCYDEEALRSAGDFNRTGERLVSFEFPSWVVSKRVREVCEEQAIQGWRFKPVLATSGREYDGYTALWTSFFSAVRESGSHRIRGGAAPDS